MQFSIVMLFAAFTSTALATPINRPIARGACDVLGCSIALGPTVVGCTAAAAELGANPFADAGCAAGTVNNLANIPAKCQGCAEDIGLDKVVDGVKNEASSVASEVKDVFTSIF